MSDTDVGGIAADRLRSLIERIERLSEEKAAIESDIRDIFAEAKGAGFENKMQLSGMKMTSYSKHIAKLWICRR